MSVRVLPLIDFRAAALAAELLGLLHEMLRTRAGKLCEGRGELCPRRLRFSIERILVERLLFKVVVRDVVEFAVVEDRGLVARGVGPAEARRRIQRDREAGTGGASFATGHREAVVAARVDGDGSGRDGSNRKRISTYGTRDREMPSGGPDIHHKKAMKKKDVTKSVLDVLNKSMKDVHKEETVNEDGGAGGVGGGGMTVAAVAGTGDSRLPASQREPGVSKKHNPVIRGLGRRKQPKM